MFGKPYIVLHETSLHPQKVTACCGFHAGGVIGQLHFFVDENYRHVTVNGDRDILKHYFFKSIA